MITDSNSTHLSGLRFAPNVKFACIALRNCSLVRLRGNAYPLNDKVVVVTKPFFGMEDHWRERLGTFRTEQLDESNLLIVARQDSAAPLRDDGEAETLRWNARTIYFGLHLLGTAKFQNGLLVTGGRADGEVEVKVVQDLVAAFPRLTGTLEKIGTRTLEGAELIARGLSSTRGTRDWQRLQRGFWTWVGAMRETFLHPRVHQFVRAVDALIASTQGRGKEQFVHRGGTFVEGRDRLKILTQLYLLRSSEEHFNDWMPAIGRSRSREDAERIGALRTYQAERLASYAYARVLSSPSLLAWFRDSQAIAAFWDLPAKQRSRLWGEPLDLGALESEHSWQPRSYP